MQDGVIKGTGNSRCLKSVSNFLALYPTYADFVSALVAGTLPIDFNGINAGGWTAIGTALNKANLLSDVTASKINTNLGAAVPSTVNEALNALAYIPMKIATGSYTGTGTYGSSNKNSIVLPFVPKLLIVEVAYVAGGANKFAGISVIGSGYMFGASVNPASTTVLLANSPHVSVTGTTVYWYTDGSSAVFQLNESGTVYHYTAIG